MNRISRLVCAMMLMSAALTGCTLRAQTEGSKLLLRIDDIGMNHSVNLALKEIAKTKMPLSASVMFACPWYQEAVEILKENPQISVGVHLTLNSEWKHYRWGPILGREAVPSLVDSIGYFHHSTAEFLASSYKLDEVEKELEAQIQRAFGTGLKIDYIDFHMRTALSTPQLSAITEKLAKKYNLKRSMLMGENYMTMFDVPVEKKEEVFIGHLKNDVDPTKVTVVINHLAIDNAEMQALFDMNNPAQNAAGESMVAKHRQAELNMLTSEKVRKAMKEKGIQLINYSDL